MLAADRDDLAGEVGRVVTGEEDDDAGDLPRVDLAPERSLAAPLGETPGQVLGKPLADAAPELLVLGAGPDPRLPGDGPAGPQGGLQARGSFVSGQQLAAARTLSLPSTCFIGGHLVELTVPAALAGAAGKFGDGPALAEPGARASVTTSYFIRPRPHTGTYRRGRNAGRPGGNLVPEHASMGARRVPLAVRRRDAGPC